MWYDESSRKKTNVGQIQESAESKPRYEFYFSETNEMSLNVVARALLDIIEKDNPQLKDNLLLINCQNPKYEAMCKGITVPRLVYKANANAPGVVYDGPLQRATILHWIKEMGSSTAY